MYFPFRYCLLTLYVVLVVYLQVQNIFSLALVSRARRTEVLVVYLQVFRLSAAASIVYDLAVNIEGEICLPIERDEVEDVDCHPEKGDGDVKIWTIVDVVPVVPGSLEYLANVDFGCVDGADGTAWTLVP